MASATVSPSRSPYSSRIGCSGDRGKVVAGAVIVQERGFKRRFQVVAALGGVLLGQCILDEGPCPFRLFRVKLGLKA